MVLPYSNKVFISSPRTLISSDKSDSDAFFTFKIPTANPSLSPTSTFSASINLLLAPPPPPDLLLATSKLYLLNIKRSLIFSPLMLVLLQERSLFYMCISAGCCSSSSVSLLFFTFHFRLSDTFFSPIRPETFLQPVCKNFFVLTSFFHTSVGFCAPALLLLILIHFGTNQRN